VAPGIGVPLARAIHDAGAIKVTVTAERPDDIALARSGFAGTEHLLSGVPNEGRRRGMPWRHPSSTTARVTLRPASSGRVGPFTHSSTAIHRFSRIPSLPTSCG
jgi:hypothetical protein